MSHANHAIGGRRAPVNAGRRGSSVDRHERRGMVTVPVPLPDGVLAVVKRDCPTCTLVAPVLVDLAGRGVALAVYSQDDPSFPEGVPVVDDTSLEVSWHLDITTVPTLIRVK